MFESGETGFRAPEFGQTLASFTLMCRFVESIAQLDHLRAVLDGAELFYFHLTVEEIAADWDARSQRKNFREFAREWKRRAIEEGHGFVHLPLGPEVPHVAVDRQGATLLWRTSPTATSFAVAVNPSGFGGNPNSRATFFSGVITVIANEQDVMDHEVDVNVEHSWFQSKVAGEDLQVSNEDAWNHVRAAVEQFIFANTAHSVRACVEPRPARPGLSTGGSAIRRGHERDVILTLRPREMEGLLDRTVGEEARRFRYHHRRGHYRTLQDERFAAGGVVGRTIWVSDCMVGDPDLGVIGKRRYRILDRTVV